jgi:TolB-like protein
MVGDVPVPLGSRAFDLLLALVEAGGELVTKEALLRRAWPDAIVEENNLQVQISALWKAFGEDAQRLIATIPGRGYRFTGAVQPHAPASDHAAGPPVAEDAASAPPLMPTSGRPVLVVLPFANMTGDPEQEYFADGITEDLTTALSHLRWFSVIARNSAFTYKARAVDVRQVGRELGVRYVLAGSVRKAGGRVRITAQLCEAETGCQVWAERFDGEIADIFALQDQVTEAVAGAIEPSLREIEIERIRTRPTESLGAYDLYLRSLPHRHATREGNDEALRLLRRAITLGPGFAAAKGALAGQVVLRVTQGWAEEGDIEEAARLARELTEAGAVDDPTALAWAAHAITFLGRDYEGGLAASNRARRLAPNSGPVLYLGAWSHLYLGDWQTAVAWTERAMRLSPVDPGMAYFTAALGAAHFVGERYEEAAAWVRCAIHDHPGYLVAHRLLAASLAQLGRLEEARAAIPALLAVAPGYTVTAAVAHSAFRSPTRERYVEGLRRAGLPE